MDVERISNSNYTYAHFYLYRTPSVGTHFRVSYYSTFLVIFLGIVHSCRSRTNQYLFICTVQSKSITHLHIKERRVVPFIFKIIPMFGINIETTQTD